MISNSFIVYTSSFSLLEGLYSSPINSIHFDTIELSLINIVISKGIVAINLSEGFKFNKRAYTKELESKALR